MLIEYGPTVQLSVLVNLLKAVTSRRLRNEFLDLRGAYSKPVLWSRSYFAGSCGGAPLEVIKQYIQNQRGLRPGEIPLPPTSEGVPFRQKRWNRELTTGLVLMAVKPPLSFSSPVCGISPGW